MGGNGRYVSAPFISCSGIYLHVIFLVLAALIGQTVVDHHGRLPPQGVSGAQEVAQAAHSSSNAAQGTPIRLDYNSNASAATPGCTSTSRTSLQINATSSGRADCLQDADQCHPLVLAVQPVCEKERSLLQQVRKPDFYRSWLYNVIFPLARSLARATVATSGTTESKAAVTSTTTTRWFTASQRRKIRQRSRQGRQTQESCRTTSRPLRTRHDGHAYTACGTKGSGNASECCKLPGQRTPDYGGSVQAQCSDCISAVHTRRPTSRNASLTGHPRGTECPATLASPTQGRECANGSTTRAAEGQSRQETVPGVLGDVHSDLGRLPPRAIPGAIASHEFLHGGGRQVDGKACGCIRHAHPAERRQADRRCYGGGLTRDEARGRTDRQGHKRSLGLTEGHAAQAHGSSERSQLQNKGAGQAGPLPNATTGQARGTGGVVQRGGDQGGQASEAPAPSRGSDRSLSTQIRPEPAAGVLQWTLPVVTWHSHVCHGIATWLAACSALEVALTQASLPVPTLPLDPRILSWCQEHPHRCRGELPRHRAAWNVFYPRSPMDNWLAEGKNHSSAAHVPRTVCLGGTLPTHAPPPLVQHSSSMYSLYSMHSVLHHAAQGSTRNVEAPQDRDQSHSLTDVPAAPSNGGVKHQSCCSHSLHLSSFDVPSGYEAEHNPDCPPCPIAHVPAAPLLEKGEHNTPVLFEDISHRAGPVPFATGSHSLVKGGSRRSFPEQLQPPTFAPAAPYTQTVEHNPPVPSAGDIEYPCSGWYRAIIPGADQGSSTHLCSSPH